MVILTLVPDDASDCERDKGVNHIVVKKCGMVDINVWEGELS